MDLTRIQYFITVAELGHMQRAAETLHVAQSTLSAAIKRQEEELGLDLFDRNGRHLELTEAGRIFLEEARAIMTQVEQCTLRMETLAEQQRRTVVLASLAPDFTSPFENWLRNIHPEITLRVLRPSSTDAVRSLLCGRQAALGITLSPLVDGSLCSSPLYLDDMLVLCKAESLPVHPSDLKSHPFITLPEYTQFFSFCSSLFSTAKLSEPEWRFVQSPEAIPFAVDRCQGVSLIPRSSFSSICSHFPDLLGVPLEELPPWELWLTTPAKPSSAARLCADALRQFSTSR